MKTSRAFLLAGLALLVGFFAARWSAAQPASQPSKEEAGPWYNMASDQLTSFVTYLQTNQPTNILKQFTDYENASIAVRSSGEIGAQLHSLYALREGQTNDVIKLLETQMMANTVIFAAVYRDMPPSQRERIDLAILRQARDYCEKYPIKSDHADVDAIITNAFKILDEKTSTK